MAATRGTRLGISLSGGGIRSATFSLGVCQRLAEQGLIERAHYLSAVSGGSYLAAGLAISQANCPPSLEGVEPLPWGKGSPEEAQLRRNLTYLAPGSKGRIWLFANLLYGLFLNLVPLVFSAFLCGGLVGLLIGVAYPGIISGGDVEMTAMPLSILLAGILVAASIAVVGRRRFLDKDRSRERLNTDSSEVWVMRLLVGAAAVLAILVLMPLILILASQFSGGRLTDLGLGGADLPIRRLIFGLLVLIGSLGMGAAAVWLLRRRRLASLRGLFAYLSGAGILFAPFVLAAEITAGPAWSPVDGWVPFLAMGAVVLVFAVVAHNRRYSMHLFYRERLQDAFASRRVEDGEEIGIERIPYDETVLLSEVSRSIEEKRAAGGRAFPELVMCAAVAARGEEVPNKTWAASFTFEGRRSGNEKMGLGAPTERFEAGDWIGGGNLTLPSMMAISGAAVSPLMGRFTLPAFRFLMAIMNFRLGVWIRNPNLSDEESQQMTDTSGTGSRGSRLWRYVVRGWREPGALYVLKEGLGLVNANGRYVYVSDGGHWENLGLTELLRRGCTHVVVVDASGDPGLGDIGRAMAVARAELGVEFKLDPRGTLAKEGELADSPVAVGSFEYPDGRQGQIYYARSVLWKGAPSDLHLFAGREQLFPNHPTSNQFLSGELFDAYRALGWAVGGALGEKISIPPDSWDEGRESEDPP